MLIKDLEIKFSKNGKLSIDGYTVIKRNGKYYIVWASVQSEDQVIHAQEMFELLQQFLDYCNKVDKEWILTNQPSGKPIREREIEL